MTSACRRVRRHLGAYVDGELPSRERLAISTHVGACEACAEEVRGIRSIGDMMRGAEAGSLASSMDLAGLAGGAVSRVMAEQAQSWRAMFGRAVEDWHWALVGVGSVTAACISVLLVSALFWFGPAPAREDSLAAMLNHLGTPAGTLLVIATPVGRDRTPMVMQFDGGGAEAESAIPVALPVEFSSPTEHDLVRALSEAVVNPDGRMSDLRSMSAPDRLRTEALLNEIERLRAVSPTGWSGARVEVHRLGLVTNTSVSGKAL